ncbi:unnamed protein product [Brassica oleracea]|uniref:(rape) hypothetical protein n=1 Tax=Brassica napus TaxID=3708 RepID=A0A816IDW5_BRANA|nr:unnamed protein product [Brassica napus]
MACNFQNKDYNGLRTRHGGLKCSTTTFDIHFGDIIVKNVSHPILIGQEYFPWNQCNKQVVLKMLPEMGTVENIPKFIEGVREQLKYCPLVEGQARYAISRSSGFY